MIDLAHVLSVSGGKDSTALWLLSKERGVDATPVFADTGNEHPLTYEYVNYLEGAIGPLKIVKADFSAQMETRRRNLPELWRARGVSEDRISRAVELMQPTGNPFLDLCMLKGRFPSTRARFCSEYLKHVPIRKQVVDPLVDAGYMVVSWQGVRADESKARANLDVVDEQGEIIVYRPLITWTADEVFDMHKKHGVKWNPLYELGMGRVGCMPCIHCRKDELLEISKRFPSEIERIAEWERLVADVSPLGRASFRTSENAEEVSPGVWVGLQTIHDDVEWSKTSRGGKQYDMYRVDEDVPMCSSLYGLCE